MIVCKELNMEFENKEQMFTYLKDNKDDLISIKKKTIFKSCDKGQGLNITPTLLKATDENKAELDDDHYYVAVNTTNILDSHKDLHVNGIWNKTAKDQQGKNYLVADHDLKLKSVIAKPKDIEMKVMDISYKSIGKSYEGSTEALVYKIAKEKINKEYEGYFNEEIQSSVRMQYVKMDLALNSDAKEDIEEKKIYDENIDLIANKDDFDSIDYFWVVKEAKNVNESSLVLFGSNNATGLLEEPLKDTPTKIEPSEDTQKLLRKKFILSI